MMENKSDPDSPLALALAEEYVSKKKVMIWI